MEWRTRVRVKECKYAHPAMWGAEGMVMYHNLETIVTVKFDKPIELTSHYGGYFHSVAVDALEVVSD
jgi:hypothetical protein